MSCGISTSFPVLFPTRGQITHALLTRAPLYSGAEAPFLARLACVRHAASVDSEPGSNSPVKLSKLRRRTLAGLFGGAPFELKILLVLGLETRSNCVVRYLVFKEPPLFRGLDQNTKAGRSLSRHC
jgi:hypothetical protein